MADEREITSLEEGMGISLPSSFRQAAGSLGRSLFFSYSLSDFNMPDEFDEIFFGGISWRTWFEAFLEPEPKAVKQDLKSLFALALTRKTLSSEIKKTVLTFEKEDIVQMIQKKLLHTKNRDTLELLLRPEICFPGKTARQTGTAHVLT